MPGTPPDLTADQIAAHQLLCEIRTRITTQRLPYQYGVETRALESLREIFDHAREAMKDNPGCSKFAALATNRLNTVVRPVTAKWHRALVEGRLASKDGADEFRGDLEWARLCLRVFAEELQQMAYGEVCVDAETPAALSKAELSKALKEVAFGISARRPGEPPSEQDVMLQISESESAAVARRRSARQRESPPGMNAVGLGLSGGGIRSATFCLGVVQVLAERGLLEDVDFLSTVSGGGYTGSFLSVTLPGGSGAELAGKPHGPDPPPIAALRANAKYLASPNLWVTWSRVTATVAGMLLNWSAPLLVALLAALVVTLTDADRTLEAYWGPSLWVSGLATGSALLLYGALMRGGRSAARAGGALLAATAGVTLLIASVPVLGRGREVMAGVGNWPTSIVLASLVGAGPAILRFVPVLSNPKVRVVALKVLLVVAALVIPVLGLAVFYGSVDVGRAESIDVPWLGPRTGPSVLGALTIAAAVVALFVINVNLTGPHRLYRDALAKTFTGEDSALTLEDLNPTHRGPYHLINATVNVPSSTNVALRDRKGDFFVFSKDWCGSVSTGYRRTKEWRMGYRRVDLKTAMAVSGAAVSSHMGLASMPTLTALITFLNVRLGFWIRNPAHPWVWRRPGFLCLLREMVSLFMSENAAWLNLSDGGHIENTGCYELLRRRCKYIIAVDGEADPGFTFGGLMTLVRHAQIDLGIHIDPRLDDLRADPSTGNSRRHAMFCRIHYPETADGRPAGTGLLLYLKLSITGNESELIKRYRGLYPEFPHQSTLDQFFDQEQFEAYRQLGVHVAEGLFSRAVLDDGSKPAVQPTTADVDAPANPPSVAAWFECLARNLLEREGPGL